MGSRTLKRGDIVLVAIGKPRPAVVVQADDIPTPWAVLLCPLTTTMLDAPLYRPSVQPSSGNGLKSPSQVMVDKVGPALLSRIDRVIGRMEEGDMLRLNVTLAVVFDLGG